MFLQSRYIFQCITDGYHDVITLQYSLSFAELKNTRSSVVDESSNTMTTLIILMNVTESLTRRLVASTTSILLKQSRTWKEERLYSINYYNNPFLSHFKIVICKINNNY